MTEAAGPYTGVEIGQRLSGFDQRGKCFNLVDQACEGFTLGIGERRAAKKGEPCDQRSLR